MPLANPAATYLESFFSKLRVSELKHTIYLCPKVESQSKEVHSLISFVLRRSATLDSDCRYQGLLNELNANIEKTRIEKTIPTRYITFLL